MIDVVVLHDAAVLVFLFKSSENKVSLTWHVKGKSVQQQMCTFECTTLCVPQYCINMNE